MTSIQLAEQAICAMLRRMGKGPNEHFQFVALMKLLDGEPPFTSADMNAALQGMADQGWIESGRPNTYVLTPLGAKAI